MCESAEKLRIDFHIIHDQVKGSSSLGKIGYVWN